MIDKTKIASKDVIIDYYKITTSPEYIKIAEERSRRYRYLLFEEKNERK